MKVLTFPNKIAPGQRLGFYLKGLGIESTTNISNPDITHVHHYNYANRRVLPQVLEQFQDRGFNVVNSKLTNIKKDYIDDVFKDVFGYSVRVNPVTHRGAMVIKSSQNATHAGRIIQGPIPAHKVDTKPRYSNRGEPHYRMYQKLIDTRISKDKIRDYRIIVMGYEPVLLLEKHIGITSTFHVAKGDYFHVLTDRTLNNAFSMDEAAKIKKFILQANVDFGEIDVLRSNYDGLIYIIDINDVPCGAVWNHTDNPDGVLAYLTSKYKDTYL
jgi:hypothetical protein